MDDRQTSIESDDLYVIVVALLNSFKRGLPDDLGVLHAEINTTIWWAGLLYPADPLALSTLDTASSLLLVGLPLAALLKVRRLLVLREPQLERERF
ncbi:hypothetical protein [Caballeronia sordidicola]|uniref:hypothetical protein n=1 Tax=Caballeronia sordidicola TaxID=196367 RepID=UPI0004D00BC3|nr:hypothetical protein [Caballeronia sordidicola]